MSDEFGTKVNVRCFDNCWLQFTVVYNVITVMGDAKQKQVQL